MRYINSRADLENLRGTADFEDVLRGLHGAFTTWNLVDGVWVAQENLSVIERFDYDKAGFLAEIAPFDFPDPVAPALPPELEPTPAPRSTAMWRARAVAKVTPHGDGTLFDAVEAAISAMTDPLVQAAASEAWERGTTFDRDGQLVPVLMAGLGMTEEDVLPLIAAAESLPA